MSDIANVIARLDKLQSLVAANQDQRLDAFTGLLTSIESGLADIVENLEKGGGAAAINAIAEAISKMQLPAPVVHTQAGPAPAPMPAPVVNIEAVIPPAPAPVVHVHVMESEGGEVVRSNVTIKRQAGHGLQPIESITIVSRRSKE